MPHTRCPGYICALHTSAGATSTGPPPSLSDIYPQVARAKNQSMDYPGRIPSPWPHDPSPLPSPGPPPSPAVWMPEQWAPPTAPRRGPTPARSLPLLPNAQGGNLYPPLPARTHTTLTPLPSHPEFLRNLESHPMIIQRTRGGGHGHDSSSSDDDFARTPSPVSSIEFAQHTAKPPLDVPGYGQPTNMLLPPPPPPPQVPTPLPSMRMLMPVPAPFPQPPQAPVPTLPPAQVPFPLGSGASTPVLCASPQPMRGATTASSTTDSSPARTPDSFRGGAVLSPSMARAIAHAHVQPTKAPLNLAAIPPPPPLPLPLPSLKVGLAPKNTGIMAPAVPQTRAEGAPRATVSKLGGPRSRVPALRGSVGAAAPALSSMSKTQSVEAPRHPAFYMAEGMIVLRVSAVDLRRQCGRRLIPPLASQG